MITHIANQVSRLGFGCGSLSGILNAPLSHEAGAAILKEAFNKGITLFDTADIYGQDGDNEILIGKVTQHNKPFIYSLFKILHYFHLHSAVNLLQGSERSPSRASSASNQIRHLHERHEPCRGQGRP